MQEQQPFLAQLVDVLLPVVSLALLSLVGIITKFAVGRMQAGMAKDVALELAAAADTVVRDLEQTVKGPIIANSRDGRLSPEDLKDIRESAMRALKDQLSNQALKVIKSNSERLEEVLGRSIEAAVSRYKDAAPIVPGQSS